MLPGSGARPRRGWWCGLLAGTHTPSSRCTETSCPHGLLGSPLELHAYCVPTSLSLAAALEGTGPGSARFLDLVCSAFLRSAPTTLRTTTAGLCPAVPPAISVCLLCHLKLGFGLSSSKINARELFLPSPGRGKGCDGLKSKCIQAETACLPAFALTPGLTHPGPLEGKIVTPTTLTVSFKKEPPGEAVPWVVLASAGRELGPWSCFLLILS